jgi:hypothetical protein
LCAFKPLFLKPFRLKKSQISCLKIVLPPEQPPELGLGGLAILRLGAHSALRLGPQDILFQNMENFRTNEKKKGKATYKF